jgi:predicted nucleic acid-binding protein
LSLYLDASVLVPLSLPEASSRLIEAWLKSAKAELIVSDLAHAEFHAALSRRVRTGELAEDDARKIRVEFDQWRDEAAQTVENLPVDIRAAARLVQNPFPKLLTPDAIHIATCRRLGVTLVSHDRRLLEVGSREGIATLNPAEDPAPA